MKSYRSLRVVIAAAWLSVVFAHDAALAQDPSTPAAAPTVAGAPLRKSSEITLAHVEGRALTLDQAIETFLSSHTGHGVLIRGEPAVRELAGRLVERELFLLEAEHLGLQDDPQVVELLSSYRKRVAADELWQREVKDKTVVTPEEVETFYSKTDVALRLTLIECATREEALDLHARVLAGEDMATLARTRSIHSSRTFDGALPYVRRGELGRQLEDEAFALETPQSLTTVIPLEKSFAFARLEERSANPDRPPRNTAIPQIRGILEERLAKQLSRELEERAEAAAKVWIDSSKLTREEILDGKDATIIVARAADDSLTLEDVRNGLELEKMRAAPPESTKDVGIEIVKQWTRAMALEAAAVQAGLLTHANVEKKCTSFRRDVMMKLLCERYVWPQTEPTEDEVRAYYEERKATEFATTPEARLAYIVLPTEQEAQDILARVRAGESFEGLARAHSKDSASSVHGGRIGWVKPGQLLPDVETKAFALATNEVDGPIETDVGFFIVKVLDRKESRIVSYATARETALKGLVKERQLAAYAKWAVALRERAAVELDEAGVKEAVEWLENEALARELERASRPKPTGAAPQGHGPAPVIPGVKKIEGHEKP